jgi:hypothetical protein
LQRYTDRGFGNGVKMKSLQVALFVVLGLVETGDCFSLTPKPCFAFLLRGDVVVTCEDKRTQITHRGDVDQFAVSNERSTLAFVTTQTVKQTQGVTEVAYTNTLLDLQSKTLKRLVGENSVVSTCGGIFWTNDLMRHGSGTRDLITGDEIVTPPYKWFRCSADRKVVVGITENFAGDLFEGIPPHTKVAPADSIYFRVFNISADGSTVAYVSDSRPLCVFSSGGPTQCAPEKTVDAVRDTLSVNDSGEVLVATHTAQECFYVSSSNFSATRVYGTGQDLCLGVGYWKPGLKTIRVLEPIGRNPQWISQGTAKLLRDWAARPPQEGSK